MVLENNIDYDDENVQWSDATFFILEQSYINRWNRMKMHKVYSFYYLRMSKCFQILTPILAFIAVILLGLVNTNSYHSDETIDRLTIAANAINALITLLATIYAAVDPTSEAKSHREASIAYSEQCGDIELELFKEGEREDPDKFMEILRLNYNHIMQNAPSIQHTDKIDIWDGGSQLSINRVNDGNSFSHKRQKEKGDNIKSPQRRRRKKKNKCDDDGDESMFDDEPTVSFSPSPDHQINVMQIHTDDSSPSISSFDDDSLQEITTTTTSESKTRSTSPENRWKMPLNDSIDHEESIMSKCKVNYKKRKNYKEIRKKRRLRRLDSRI